MSNIKDLNEKELQVLNEVINNIKQETGSQFGWTDEMSIPECMSQNQLKGYLSQLVQKDYICIWEDNQVQVTEKTTQAIPEATNFETA